jgi:hypothetical protein
MTEAPVTFCGLPIRATAAVPGGARISVHSELACFTGLLRRCFFSILSVLDENDRLRTANEAFLFGNASLRVQNKSFASGNASLRDKNDAFASGNESFACKNETFSG